jgi:hypothetical protein
MSKISLSSEDLVGPSIYARADESHSTQFIDLLGHDFLGLHYPRLASLSSLFPCTNRHSIHAFEL